VPFENKFFGECWKGVLLIQLSRTEKTVTYLPHKKIMARCKCPDIKELERGLEPLTSSLRVMFYDRCHMLSIAARSRHVLTRKNL